MHSVDRDVPSAATRSWFADSGCGEVEGQLAEPLLWLLGAAWVAAFFEHTADRRLAADRQLLAFRRD